MKYFKYDPKGNSVGIDDGVVSYWEVDRDNFIVRSVDMPPGGNVLKYDGQHNADSYGQLPEGQIAEDDLKDESYGQLTEISYENFQDIWKLKSINYH